MEFYIYIYPCTYIYIYMYITIWNCSLLHIVIIRYYKYLDFINQIIKSQLKKKFITWGPACSATMAFFSAKLQCSAPSRASSNASPIYGWFIMENPKQKGMIQGYPMTKRTPPCRYSNPLKDRRVIFILFLVGCWLVLICLGLLYICTYTHHLFIIIWVQYTTIL